MGNKRERERESVVPLTLFPIQDENRAEQFEILAEGLEADIENRFADRLANTARRARMAEAAYTEGERLERVQKVLFRMAELHRTGMIHPYLKPIRTRALVSWLLPKAILYGATKDQAEALGYSEYAIWSDELLERIFTGEYYADDRARLESIGVYNARHLRQTLEALKDLHQPPSEEEIRARKLRELCLDLVGCKIDGYFPTPPDVVDRLIQLARLEPGLETCEPQAGKGDIADRLRDIVGEKWLSVCEVSWTLRQILEFKGHNILEFDWLECTDRQFHRIVQNPPFENFQDIDHVLHSYDRLYPGGRLVSVMCESTFFSKTKKAVKFREWLEELYSNAWVEKGVEGAFLESDRPTGVRYRIVTIDKPE